MHDPLSEDELELIQNRANLATPGPWHVGGDYVVAVNDSAAEDWGTESTVVAQGLTSTDAEFMAHARTDVLRLVAELRRLRQGQP